VAPPRYITRDQAAAWLRWLRRDPDRAGSNLVRLYRLLIYTGCRPSELTRATWAEIDWDAGLTSSGHAYAVLVRTKWKNSANQRKQRRIVILPHVRRMLTRLHAKAVDPHDVILHSATGLPISESNLAVTTGRLRRRAVADGVDIPGTGASRTTSYLFRHLAATKLIQAGVDIVVVAELLGTSVLQISRTYAHLLTGHLAAAADVLQRGGRRPPPDSAAHGRRPEGGKPRAADALREVPSSPAAPAPKPSRRPSGTGGGPSESAENSSQTG
jgi:integrase